MISLYGLTPTAGLGPPGPVDLVESPVVCGRTCAMEKILRQSIVMPKKIRLVVFLM
jgi:hypothetical protein